MVITDNTKVCLTTNSQIKSCILPIATLAGDRQTDKHTYWLAGRQVGRQTETKTVGVDVSSLRRPV